MKSYLLVVALMVAAWSSNAQVFKVDTVLNNGSVNKYINIVILGDGYRANQQAKFRQDIDSMIAFFFSWSPLSNYKNYFNVFGIEVISTDSGLTHPNTAPDCAGYGVPVLAPNTYLQGALDAFNIHRLLGFNNTTASNVLAANFSSYDQAMVMSNANYYGGAGGAILSYTANPGSRDIATHEFGHSFAQLADEYYAGDVYAAEKANMTATSNPATVKWKAWIGGNVGVFQHCCGGNSANWYKPTSANCKMELLGKTFCPVCTEAIIESIHTRVNPIVSSKPPGTIVSTPQQMISFALTKLMKPIPNTLRIQWNLNGNIVGSNVDSIIVDQNTLPPGTSNLTVSVTDTTSLLRITGHSTIHVTSVSWMINKTNTGVTTTASNSEFSYQIFPNPVQDQLTVAMNLPRSSKVAFEVFSTDGKLVRAVSEMTVNAGKQAATINVSDFIPGTYLLVLKVDGQSFTERWVKQ
jgi:hypothetical protein